MGLLDKVLNGTVEGQEKQSDLIGYKVNNLLHFKRPNGNFCPAGGYTVTESLLLDAGAEPIFYKNLAIPVPIQVGSYVFAYDTDAIPVVGFISEIFNNTVYVKGHWMENNLHRSSWNATYTSVRSLDGVT